MIIDGTSNTNALRLPLLAAVGVGFSYCPSEIKEAFGFFLDSLKRSNLFQGSEIR